MARRKLLTDAYVASLKPKAKRYAVPDPELPSFYVRVQPTGHKSYIAVATDPGGKQIGTTIGTVQLYAVAQAREKAREIIRAVRAGDGTGAETFMSVAGQWLKRHVVKNGLRTRGEIERVLAKYIFPKWAGRTFVSIKRSDIAELLDHVEDKHGGRQADCCRVIFSSIATFYEERHDDYTSPLPRKMARRSPTKKHQRSRFLNDDELRAVWAVSAPGDTFGDLVKLLLLTGQRREKVVSMRWADLSDDLSVWKIPAEAREKGNGGTLALPAMAVEILRQRTRFASNPFVFPSGRGKVHFNGFSKNKADLDKRLAAAAGHDLPQWQLDDLRRTARTLMSRAGVNDDHAERALGHAIEGVKGVYDQHQYDGEKAKALKVLAAQIERILRPTANVTSMRRVRT